MRCKVRLEILRIVAASARVKSFMAVSGFFIDSTPKLGKVEQVLCHKTRGDVTGDISLYLELNLAEHAKHSGQKSTPPNWP